MKYLIVLASGLPDEPLEELDGRTPLETADTPTLDEIAVSGKLASVVTLPEDLPPSEGIGLLSALGYDPHIHFPGEAGLAAASIIGDLPEGEVAFIHNFVTEADGIIRDHAAEHIPPAEAEVLLTALAHELDDEHVRFYVAAGYTGLTVMNLSVPPPKCVPPEAMWERPIEKGLPRGKGSENILTVINTSRNVFAEHEINRVRADLGENPANLLWLWGPGRPQTLPSFESIHHLQAAMIAASASARGLAKLAGMELLDPPETSSVYSPDYAAMARTATEALARSDVVTLHIDAPAEAALEGDEQRKIAVIQDLDAHLLAPLFRFATKNEFIRLLVLPTHMVSVARRTRLRTAIPAAMFGPGLEPVRGNAFTEKNATRGEIIVERGHELLPYFLRP